MPLSQTRLSAAAIPLALLLTLTPAFGQSGNGKGPDQIKGPAQTADPAKERQRKIDEFAEAQRAIQGGAGQPECVWVGRRIVALMWRDDLNTAFRHIELYDRFGCPGGHIQMTFRCLVRNGNIDPKVPESLNNRIHACWVDPGMKPAAAAKPAPDNATGAAGSRTGR